jgi:hypothetical protein
MPLSGAFSGSDEEDAMTEDFDALKAAVSDAERSLAEAKKRYHSALIASHRLRIGDIIRSGVGGVEALVVGFNVRSAYVEPVLVLRKKDGSWGERRVSVNWIEGLHQAPVVGHED